MELIFSTEALFFVTAIATIATECTQERNGFGIARYQGRRVAEIAKKVYWPQFGQKRRLKNELCYDESAQE